MYSNQTQFIGIFVWMCISSIWFHTSSIFLLLMFFDQPHFVLLLQLQTKPMVFLFVLNPDICDLCFLNKIVWLNQNICSYFECNYPINRWTFYVMISFHFISFHLHLHLHLHLYENRTFRDVVSAICLEVLLGIPLTERMSIQTC